VRLAAAVGIARKESIVGIREKLNENPAITTSVTVLIIVIAVGYIIYQQIPSGVPKAPTQAYFSIDDGKTWFADDINKVAPFEKDGKQAVRVHVFRCGRGEPFVAFMERLLPDAKKQVDALMAQGSQDPETGYKIAMIKESGSEYKRPGDARWIRMSENPQAFGEIMNVTCPDANEVPEVQFP